MKQWNETGNRKVTKTENKLKKKKSKHWTRTQKNNTIIKYQFFYIWIYIINQTEFKYPYFNPEEGSDKMPGRTVYRSNSDSGGGGPGHPSRLPPTTRFAPHHPRFRNFSLRSRRLAWDTQVNTRIINTMIIIFTFILYFPIYLRVYLILNYISRAVDNCVS